MLLVVDVQRGASSPALSRRISSRVRRNWSSHAREYVAKVEGELQKIRDGILALMDKELIPPPGTDELKVLYYKMKSDYYRYLAEYATDDAKGKATESACVAHVEANKIAENDLAVTHPIRWLRH